MTKVVSSRPVGLDRKQELYLDAFEVLSAAALVGYSRIVSEALAHTQGQVSTPIDLPSLIVADVSQFIGTMERLRKVVVRLPGTTPEVRTAKKAFEGALAPFTEARNFFEHIDTSIPGLAETGHGAFGSVTWWMPPNTPGGGRVVGILTGTLAVGTDQIQTVVPNVQELRPPLDRLMAVVGGSLYDLTAAHDALLRLNARLATAYAAPAPEEGA